MSTGAGAAAAELKPRKKQKREDREKEVRAAEQARAQGGADPKSAEEFDSALLAAPDSSFLWIKYLAFLISQHEVDLARAVAERALQTISYRWVSFRVCGV